MKEQLQNLLLSALAHCELPAERDQVKIENARDKKHGDYATNIAMMLAKQAKTNPRELAEKIIAAIPENSLIDRIDIAGPGFINFTLADAAYHELVNDILRAGNQYGRCNIGQGEKVHIEYVSANPTGPLHVGHGRGAAYGATVSNLLSAVGFNVHREYYVNDAGRQMHILATSVWLRYLELFGVKFNFPEAAYKGDYIVDFAKTLQQKHDDLFNTELSVDSSDDKEKHIDSLIAKAKTALGENYHIVFKTAVDSILADIRDDLHEFGVDYDEWFSEQSLVDDGLLQHGINALQKKGCLYEKDGAKWFSAIEFGDEKDRVVVRDNGQPTYFASDVAYHLNKYERGFDHIIDIFGADHHGYISRINAFLQALGKDPKKLNILLVQFAVLYRGKERLKMSTRSGEFVTLRELRNEVGNDAARFFYIMRKAEQHMDFDLELAKSKSNENPVYYIQYAHARICSVLQQLAHKKLSWSQDKGLSSLATLTTDHEKDLLRCLTKYSQTLVSAAINYEPHQLAYYLQELANYFHTYYNAQQFLVDEEPLRNARLCLIVATKQVIANGLQLLGLSAPESM